MLISDWTFWKARCDLAASLNTDVGTLECMVWATILKEAGLWDPKKPKDLPTKVLVKVRDLQDRDKAKRMGVNHALQAEMVRSSDEVKDVDPFDTQDNFDDR